MAESVNEKPSFETLVDWYLSGQLLAESTNDLLVGLLEEYRANKEALISAERFIGALAHSSEHGVIFLSRKAQESFPRNVEIHRRETGAGTRVWVETGAAPESAFLSTLKGVRLEGWEPLPQGLVTGTPIPIPDQSVARVAQIVREANEAFRAKPRSVGEQSEPRAADDAEAPRAQAASYPAGPPALNERGFPKAPYSPAGEGAERDIFIVVKTTPWDLGYMIPGSGGGRRVVLMYDSSDKSYELVCMEEDS